MAQEPIIEAVQLTKVYNGHTAVDHLDLTVYGGEIFGFLGPNGAGKTTTLLMMLGLTEPTGGTVRVMGLDPARHPLEVKASIGYLQENMGFYRDLTGRQSLAYIAELNGLERKIAQERIQEALEAVGITAAADKKVVTYSRGMRQRLGIAEVLIKKPRIAFLDEPTLGLDPEATNRMIELIKDLCRRHEMTVVLSSHFLNQIQKICQRVGIMIEGKLVAQGPIEQLAREKLGVGDRTYTLEEIYMQYFQEH